MAKGSGGRGGAHGVGGAAGRAAGLVAAAGFAARYLPTAAGLASLGRAAIKEFANQARREATQRAAREGAAAARRAAANSARTGVPRVSDSELRSVVTRERASRRAYFPKVPPARRRKKRK
jgi:hypothetical protein